MSDWLSYTKNEVGTVLSRYLYANGRPLRIGFPNSQNSPSYYFRYTARGDANYFVAKQGTGDSGWFPFGAWGDKVGDSGNGSIGFYHWNAAWGYMRFPSKMNFDAHDESDMGLYFAHGRWYNQDTGLFLSPNDVGDYMVGGDGPCVQDAVNCGWSTAGKLKEQSNCISEWHPPLVCDPFVFGVRPKPNEIVDLSLPTQDQAYDMYMSRQGWFMELGNNVSPPGLRALGMMIADEGGSFGGIRYRTYLTSQEWRDKVNHETLVIAMGITDGRVTPLSAKKIKVFRNQMPLRLDGELRDAQRLGIRRTSEIGAEFDKWINEGTIKWVVTQDGKLWMVPKMGDEIKHTVASLGDGVIAAGEADIHPFGPGKYYGAKITDESGHYYIDDPSWKASLQIGRDAFKKLLGIEFP